MRVEVVQNLRTKRDQEHTAELLQRQCGNGIRERVRARHAKERPRRMHAALERAGVHGQPIAEYLRFELRIHSGRPQGRQVDMMVMGLHHGLWPVLPPTATTP